VCMYIHMYTHTSNTKQVHVCPHAYQGCKIRTNTRVCVRITLHKVCVRVFYSEIRGVLIALHECVSVTCVTAAHTVTHTNFCDTAIRGKISQNICKTCHNMLQNLHPYTREALLNTRVIIMLNTEQANCLAV
jgi:hypothetical protein